MAATNQTSNYGLPQWLGSDKLERTDMNTAMAEIDTNLNLVDNTVTSHLAETMTEIKAITRDLTLTGVQVISLNIKNRKLKSVIMLVSVPGTIKSCIGMYSKDSNIGVCDYRVGGTGVRYQTAKPILIGDDASNRTYTDIQNITEGSFELNWQKYNNGATGTADLKFLVQYHGE